MAQTRNNARKLSKATRAIDKASAKFHLFSKLPLELQDRIWDLGVRKDSRTIEVVVVVACKKPTEHTDICDCWSQDTLFVPRAMSAASEPYLQVCKRSRDSVHRVRSAILQTVPGGIKIRFNPDRDTISISQHQANMYSTTSQVSFSIGVNPRHLDWTSMPQSLQKVRHIAVPIEFLGSDAHCFGLGAIKQFEQLSSVKLTAYHGLSPLRGDRRVDLMAHDTQNLKNLRDGIHHLRDTGSNIQPPSLKVVDRALVDLESIVDV